MAEYPYVMSPDKVPGFFTKIGGIGIPQKFTNQTLKSIGYTSSNDARFIGLVRFLGLIDPSGSPTPRWTDLRKNPKGAIGSAVRSSYTDLFQQFPDAQQRDDEALRTYFSANSGVGADTVSKMVSTFKAICRLGEFPNAEHGSVLEEETPAADIKRISRSEGRLPRIGSHDAGLTLNINIQLQLPADATQDTYERFFSAMRKHLISTSAENA